MPAFNRAGGDEVVAARSVQEDGRIGVRGARCLGDLLGEVDGGLHAATVQVSLEWVCGERWGKSVEARAERPEGVPEEMLGLGPWLVLADGHDLVLDVAWVHASGGERVEQCRK